MDRKTDQGQGIIYIKLYLPEDIYFLFLACPPFQWCHFNLQLSSPLSLAVELSRHPTDSSKKNPPAERRRTESCRLFQPVSVSVFVLRLLENTLLNAEVKEGEILPPTIQKLMKGYNKYLRPFFDSKEAAQTCRCGNDKTVRGWWCNGEWEEFKL